MLTGQPKRIEAKQVHTDPPSNFILQTRTQTNSCVHTTLDKNEKKDYAYPNVQLIEVAATKGVNLLPTKMKPNSQNRYIPMAAFYLFN